MSDPPAVPARLPSSFAGEALALERLIKQVEGNIAETRRAVDMRNELLLTRLDTIQEYLRKILDRLDALAWATRE